MTGVGCQVGKTSSRLLLIDARRVRVKTTFMRSASSVAASVDAVARIRTYIMQARAAHQCVAINNTRPMSPDWGDRVSGCVLLVAESAACCTLLIYVVLDRVSGCALLVAESAVCCTLLIYVVLDRVSGCALLVAESAECCTLLANYSMIYVGVTKAY